MLSGEYVHKIGMSPTLDAEPEFFYREIVRPYTIYEITNKKTWHSVQPLERSYTIMLNGPPWTDPHHETRTTRGKDLDQMKPQALSDHLDTFKQLLNDYLETEK